MLTVLRQIKNGSASVRTTLHTARTTGFATLEEPARDSLCSHRFNWMLVVLALHFHMQCQSPWEYMESLSETRGFWLLQLAYVSYQ